MAEELQIKSIILSPDLRASEDTRKAFEDKILQERAPGRELRPGTLEILIEQSSESSSVDPQTALLVTFEWSQQEVPVILRASPYQLLRFARQILNELDPSNSQ